MESKLKLCPACGKPLTKNHGRLLVIMVPLWNGSAWVDQATHPNMN